MSYECYSFKICKQKLGGECSAYITHLERMNETHDYGNLDTEIKDQFIMSCKSKKMREKLILEQDLTLTKLADICWNMESVKLETKEKDDGTEIKKVFHQIKNLHKNLENRTWINFKILRNPVINVEKNIQMDIKTIAKP